jgi:hypothetical protein
MNLDEAQRQRVTAWVLQGAKLSDIQNRLAEEFGIKLTYMEVRFLVDDLKLTLKDPDPPKVDQLARPGAIVSGKVAFSDGQQADWYLDQAGRLGVAPKQQGYKPSAADVQQFQAALEKEITRMGF